MSIIQNPPTIVPSSSLYYTIEDIEDLDFLFNDIGLPDKNEFGHKLSLVQRVLLLITLDQKYIDKYAEYCEDDPYCEYDYRGRNKLENKVEKQASVAAVADILDFKLSEDQTNAWAKIKNWVYNLEDTYFVLKGYAGSGKTTMLKKLCELPISVLFTAPTNKATKVLALTVKRKCRTTYSTLGLRMEQVEDELVLTSSKELVQPFPENTILVIDEASMCGTVLCDAVDVAVKAHSLRVIYVGDPIQLPPVKESKSKALTMDNKDCLAVLKTVVRNDSELLDVATKIRANISDKKWKSPIKNDHKEDTGIWKLRSAEEFEQKLLSNINFPSDMYDTKVIAWRNKTVEYYNEIIRDKFGFKDRFCINDILLIAEPVQKEGLIIAFIDDEFTVQSVDNNIITVLDKGKSINIKTYQLVLKNEDKIIMVDVANDQEQLNKVLQQKALFARSQTKTTDRKLAWADFWTTKSKFNRVRYSYALTAHRSQGSTFETVYVDQLDILTNPKSREAFKCLYVACTRPTKKLYTY